MNNDEFAPVILSPNYSGTFEHVPVTNGDLLQLTDPRGTVIHAPALFVLKYRVLPCTMIGNLEGSTGDYNDIFTYNLTGQFSNLSRGRRWVWKKQTRRHVSCYKVSQLI